MALGSAVYKGMHKKAKQSKITAFFTVTPSTIHSTSIMLINFLPETPAQMTACLLYHLASKLIAKCKVFTIIYAKSHVSRVYNLVNLCGYNCSCDASSLYKCFVLVYQYFPKYMQ